MDDVEAEKLKRENAYLKLRCAQLQDDVDNLGGQLSRVEQTLGRLQGVRAGRAGGEF